MPKSICVIDKLTCRIVETYPSITACASAKDLDRPGLRKKACPGHGSDGCYWYRLEGELEPITYGKRDAPVAVRSPGNECLFFPNRHKAAEFLGIDHARMCKKEHGWTRKEGSRWYWRRLDEPVPDTITSKPDPDNHQARILLDGAFVF